MATMLIPSLALSIKEAADELGVCSETIENLIRQGDIPSSRVGRRVIIIRDDLEAFLLKNRTVKKQTTQRAFTIPDIATPAS